MVHDLGSPELSLKALMAYPDVKIVASFVYCCFKGGSTASIACLGMTF
jgi:hypothetical protein